MLCRFSIATLTLFLTSALLTAQDCKVALSDFNSPDSDFSPVIYGESVIFCSNRARKIYSSNIDSANVYYTDLYRKDIGDESDPYIFSRSLTGWLNEGPCTFSPNKDTIYYTGNIVPKIQRNKKKLKVYKLGIFGARWNGSQWVEMEPFVHNNNDYNVAHPALTPDGKTMVFASNSPKSMGGADLFITHRTETGWSEPENMGPAVNTPKEDLFPFIDQNYRLYFSSNGRDVSNGMDLFYSDKWQGTWSTPKRMSPPINGEFDDFGFTINETGSSGFFSSNRESNTDNIFEFEYFFPEFRDCNQNHRPVFCYFIEDQDFPMIDTLPIALEWDLGDGTMQKGRSIEHCYEDTGRFHVKLNLIDTTTHFTYKQVSEAYISIERLEQPYIQAPDTLKIGEGASFVALGEELTDFQVANYYWDFGDGAKVEGAQVNHFYPEMGNYRLKVGAMSRPNARGITEKTCAYKDIVVIDSTNWVPTEVDPQQPIRIDIEPLLPIESILQEIEQTTYVVELARSKSRLTFNNPVFEQVSHVITETYDATTAEYAYVIGPLASHDEVETIQKDLAQGAMKPKPIKHVVLEQFQRETVKRGEYIRPSDDEQLNREFRGLQNIQFEYDSDVILAESFDNLEYIAAMLSLEKDFHLHIKAHTCDIGGALYNNNLSSRRAFAVVEHLTQAGISLHQVSWTGLGLSDPQVPNNDDDSRAINRRVEFIVSFKPLAQ